MYDLCSTKWCRLRSQTFARVPLAGAMAVLAIRVSSPACTWSVVLDGKRSSCCCFRRLAHGSDVGHAVGADITPRRHFSTAGGLIFPHVSRVLGAHTATMLGNAQAKLPSSIRSSSPARTNAATSYCRTSQYRGALLSADLDSEFEPIEQVPDCWPCPPATWVDAANMDSHHSLGSTAKISCL